MAWSNGRRSHLKWLVPGMHVKRWLLLLMLGSIVLSLGVAVLLRGASNNELLSPIIYYGLLQFCLLYTSPSPRDRTRSRMPSSA